MKFSKLIKSAVAVLVCVFQWHGLASMTVNDANDLPRISGQAGLTHTPIWRISEPYINLWIEDVPLGYQPARGPGVSFGLAYRQRGPRPFDEDPDLKSRIFSVGSPWTCSWLAYVAYTDASTTVNVQLDGGGMRTFTADGQSIDYLTNTKLNRILDGSVVSSFERIHPNGAKEIYSVIIQGTVQKYAFRTAIVDTAGNAISFNYITFTDGNGKLNLRLSSISDADGRSTFLSYNSGSSFPNNVIRVTDPASRHADLSYDSWGRLSSIRNAGGLLSSFGYAGNDWISSMNTPHGITSFNLMGPTNATADGRAAVITLADGSRELFLYRDGLSGYLPSAYPSQEVPGTGYLTSFENSGMFDRNSFHWDRKQYTALSQGFRDTLNIYSLTAEDYRKGRLRHWLKENASGVSSALSMERQASPDGILEGQKTWLDYEGQPGNDTRGTQVLPRFIAQVLGSNPARWTRLGRNEWGHVIEALSSYTDPYTGAAAVRTYTYAYASGGIDLLQEQGPQGEVLRSYTYNGNHQVLTLNRRVDAQTQYTTAYTYDSASHQLTHVARPDGSSTSYSYTAGRRISQITDQPLGRTQTFSYHGNGLVNTYTDERGFVRTFTWDNLQRITQIDFSDGSYLLHNYNGPNIFLTQDRRGYATTFACNALGQVVSMIQPYGRETQYTYSLSGPVETIRNALAQTTRFDYDNNGRLTRITDHGGKSVNYSYNPLDQLVSLKDHNGNVIEQRVYNNQGLFCGVLSPEGQSTLDIHYDIRDRPLQVSDVSRATLTHSFDDLGRVDTQEVSGGGINTFDYSALGLEGLNQEINPGLIRSTQFNYNLNLREITRTDALLQTTRTEFNPAGDLTRLVDQRQKNTHWNTDNQGRLSSKVDHLGQTVMILGYDAESRVTSRWTPARGTTYFSYDALGNLTTINYPNDPDVSFTYDAVNRLSSMSDGTGVNRLLFKPQCDILGHNERNRAKKERNCTKSNKLREIFITQTGIRSIIKTTSGRNKGLLSASQPSTG